MCDWVADVADALQPIVDRMKEEITRVDYLQTDDTPVKVLVPRGEGFKGRLWVYLDPLNRQVVFDATTTHEGKFPAEFLKSFEGYLQADAYAGYDGLYRSKRIVEVGCWSHGRRRFVDSLAIDTRAAPVLALTAVQAGVIALGSLVLAFALPGGLPPLPHDASFWWACIYLVVGCTVFAFVAQNWALRHSSPSRVGLLMGSEPAFGALFAVLWLGESLSAAGWAATRSAKSPVRIQSHRAVRGVLTAAL